MPGSNEYRLLINFSKEMSEYERAASYYALSLYNERVKLYDYELSQSDRIELCEYAIKAIHEGSSSVSDLVSAATIDYLSALTYGAVSDIPPDIRKSILSINRIRSALHDHAVDFIDGHSSCLMFARRVSDIASREVLISHSILMDDLLDSHEIRPRWRRVPVGKTCEYCSRLAQSGYSYESAQDAAKRSHAHCNCLCIPDFAEVIAKKSGYGVDGFDGLPRSEEVIVDGFRGVYVSRSFYEGAIDEIEAEASFLDGLRKEAWHHMMTKGNYQGTFGKLLKFDVWYRQYFI